MARRGKIWNLTYTLAAHVRAVFSTILNYGPDLLLPTNVYSWPLGTWTFRRGVLTLKSLRNNFPFSFFTTENNWYGTLNRPTVLIFLVLIDYSNTF